MKRFQRLTILLLTVFLLAALAGCSTQSDLPSDSSVPSQSAAPSTDGGDDPTVPTEVPQLQTLEQELLARRGLAFDQSDYTTLLGGEGIIDRNTLFDGQIDYGYSKDIDCLFLNNGEIYRSNFNMLLSNAKNVEKIGELPAPGLPQYWRFTYDGESGTVYYRDGAVYKLRAQSPTGPYTAEALTDPSYALFVRVYRYNADGKSLVDCTDEYRTAEAVYTYFGPTIVFHQGKISLLFPAQALDAGTTDWNWYRSMGSKTYIAFPLDLTPLDGETPLRLFNNNIVMTDKGFYELVYDSEPLDEREVQAQLAPDGTVSPYFPAAEHKNCRLTLRKLELLSRYYDNVLNICTSHVITTDYKLLPIGEIMTEGYDKYFTYDCLTFAHAYRN